MKSAVAKFDPSSAAPKVTSLIEHLESRAAKRAAWLHTPDPTPATAAATVKAAPAPASITPLHDEVADARAAAEEEGLRAAQARVETVVQRYADGIRRLGEVAQRAARPDASELVSLAMVVAQQIVGHELSLDRDAVVNTVENALATVADDPSVRVRLGTADLAFLKQRRPELLDGNIQLIEDNSLSVGGCIVETALRVVDSSMERRMDAIRQALEAMMVRAPEIRDPAGESEAAPEIEEIEEQIGSAC